VHCIFTFRAIGHFFVLFLFASHIIFVGWFGFGSSASFCRLDLSNVVKHYHGLGIYGWHCNIGPTNSYGWADFKDFES